MSEIIYYDRNLSIGARLCDKCTMSGCQTKWVMMMMGPLLLFINLCLSYMSSHTSKKFESDAATARFNCVSVLYSAGDA